MPCPHCDSDNLDILDEDYSNPNHHLERYLCNDCNTVFIWESTRIVEEEGEEEVLNKQLKELLTKKEIIEEDGEEEV